VPGRRQGRRGTVRLQQDFGEADTLDTLSRRWAGRRLSDLTDHYDGGTLATITADHYFPWNDFGTVPPTLREFDLTLTGRSLDARDGTIRIDLESDEVLLQDHALVSRYAESPTIATVQDAVDLALAHIGAALDDDASDARVAIDDLDALAWQPGVSAWDYLAPLLQKAGLRLYCSERRQWRLVPATTNAGDEVEIAATKNLTAGQDEIRRDGDWFDAVVLTYKWQDANENQQIAYDVAGDRRSIKTYAETRELPYPGPGAAALLLERKQGRGRMQDVEAVARYDVEPGRPILIRLPDTTPQSGYVSSVSWSIPNDTMRVSSRELTDTQEAPNG
jgi:hypothetical protein